MLAWKLLCLSPTLFPPAITEVANKVFRTGDSGTAWYFPFLLNCIPHRGILAAELVQQSGKKERAVLLLLPPLGKNHSLNAWKVDVQSSQGLFNVRIKPEVKETAKKCSEALGNAEKVYASSMNVKEILTLYLLTNFSYSPSQLEIIRMFRATEETAQESVQITGFAKLPLAPF